MFVEWIKSLGLLHIFNSLYIPLLFVKFAFEFWHRFMCVDIVCISLINDAPFVPIAEDDKFCDVDIAVSILCPPPPYNVLVECKRSSPNIKWGSEHVNVATANTIIPDIRIESDDAEMKVKKEMTKIFLNGLTDELSVNLQLSRY